MIMLATDKALRRHNPQHHWATASLIEDWIDEAQGRTWLLVETLR